MIFEKKRGRGKREGGKGESKSKLSLQESISKGEKCNDSPWV